MRDRSEYLDAAVAIADGLVREGVGTANGTTWHTDDLVGDASNHTLIERRCRGDLYGGTAGIAWFLGHVAALAGSDQFAATAIDALRFAMAATDSEARPPSPSLFSGAMGVALAAVDVGERLERQDLRTAGLSLAARVAGATVEAPDDERDLIAGTAGVVIGLLALHRRHPDPRYIEGCRRACAHLLQGGMHDGWGRSWPEHDGAPALCGLGHGMSGIAWALAEMAWTTGDAACLDAVGETFRYERGWFSPERGNWPDLREFDEHALAAGVWPGWMTAWCHGALGIGAVRLRHYEMTRDLTSLAEASAAIHAVRALTVQAGTALRNGESSDATLCHGLGGAAELCLLAHEVFQSADHLRAARRVGDLCLDSYERHGRWPLGLRGGRWVPGLFLGLAGIGVTMLRLYDPGSIGSPLLPGRPQPRAVTA